MTKIYPNASSSSSSSSSSSKCEYLVADDPTPALVLTVWKKSLLLNCDGFTVFDPHGNLVYRVDTYTSATKAHLFLMDASGNTLLTIRRKRLSLGDTWVVFDGETVDNPRFSVRKNVLNNLLNGRCVADVRSCGEKKYEIEGSYARHCFGVYDEKRRRVAEIRQKEASVKGVAFGRDVFRLVVQPGLDAAVAMAVVIVLDQMSGYF